MDDLTFLTTLGVSDLAVPMTMPTFGLQLWLDANDSATITIGTGVSQWTDKSGVGNTVTQATGLLQPTYVAGVQNGKPIVRFDGATQFLTKTTPVALSNLSAFTIFMVASADNTVGNDGAVGLFNGINQRAWRLLRLNAAAGRTLNTSLDGSSTIASTATGGTSTVFATTYATLNGTNQFISSTATTDTDAQTAILNSTADLEVGSTAGQFWDGDIAEILFYNRLLNAPEITATLLYLNTKWGL